MKFFEHAFKVGVGLVVSLAAVGTLMLLGYIAAPYIAHSPASGMGIIASGLAVIVAVWIIAVGFMLLYTVGDLVLDKMCKKTKWRQIN